MTAKTPISALQELMAARGIPLPVYVEGSNAHLFKCTVYADGITAVGSGITKKAAKHDSAQKALEVLRIPPTFRQVILENKSPVLRPMRNYVGELNEFASKRGVRYPEYHYLTLSPNGECIIQCNFMGQDVVGRGLNKKDAKQDSARQVLERVDQTAEVDKQHQLTTSQTLMEVKDREKLISIFNRLSINKPLVNATTGVSVEPTPFIEIGEEDTLEALESKMKTWGITYSTTTLQKNPYIAYVRVNAGHGELHFLGCDNSDFDEALRKALKNVLAVKKEGCSMATNLIDFE